MSRVEFSLSGLFDSNIDHRPSGFATYGMEAGVLARIRSQARDPRVRLEYEGSIVSYHEVNRWNRIKHRIEGIGAQPLPGPWSAELLLEVESNGSTEDRELANHYTVSPRLPVDLHRTIDVTPFAGYRLHEVEGVPGSNEATLFGGLELKGRGLPGTRWELEYQYEDREGQTDSRSYLANRWSCLIRVRLGRNDVAAGVENRIRRFTARPVETADGIRPRRDGQWTPELTWRHDSSWGQILELSYEYESMASNDPDRPYSGHRLSMTVRSHLIR